MSMRKSVAMALGAFTLLTVLSASTLAARVAPARRATTVSQADGARSRGPRASLHLDLGKTKAWVGQAIPITLTASFRDVEGITLEAAPLLESKSLIVSNLSQKPEQSRQALDGEPILAVTWKGMLTPLAPGPIQVSVSLPARLQYREAPVPIAVPNPENDDVFGDLLAGPLDPSSLFNQMRRQMQHMIERPAESLRTQDIVLKATTRTVEAIALPNLGRPEAFTGAVGRFQLKASVSSTHVQMSDPVTLRIEVDGSGDLDRVDLAGVTSSASWKAYPMNALNQPSTPEKRPGRKIFEQVLLPLNSGVLTVPAVAFTAFDPTLEQYVTRETTPQTVSVDGTASVALTTTVDKPLAAAAAIPLAKTVPILPHSRMLTLTRGHLGLGAAVIALLVLAAAAYRARRRSRSERALYGGMRRAASEGCVAKFFESARSLIQARLARLWAMSPDEVNSQVILARLGPKGEPLAELILAEETLRFARGGLENGNLKRLCSDVERSLRAAS